MWYEALRQANGDAIAEFTSTRLGQGIPMPISDIGGPLLAAASDGPG